MLEAMLDTEKVLNIISK